MNPREVFWGALLLLLIALSALSQSTPGSETPEPGGRVVLVLPFAIESEKDLLNPVVFGRLSAEHKFAVHEPLALVIQQQ